MHKDSGPKEINLDVFDIPIKRFLRSRIKDLGYDPSSLLPIMEVAIDYSKKQVRKMIKKGKIIHSFILRSRMEELAYNNIEAVLSQGSKLKQVKDNIRSYASVFLVGAGISFESDMPLTNVLTSLLRFCLADDYKTLAKDKDKRKKFQLEFRRICDAKRPGTSHKTMALNFPKYVLEILCLNWDNLLERAFREYGRDFCKVNEESLVNGKRYLWKFHGDVEKISEVNIKGKGGWIFPDEEGYVFNCFSKYIDESGLKNTLFTFVIVGYSEQEKEIYERVINTFEKEPPRPTFRIGLNLNRLSESNYIVGPSDYILQQILPS